jgi:ribonuclease BN (tRNA processing enzyme)
MEESGLKIKFTGTGGGFEPRMGNSSAILQFAGKNLLIDCGHAVFPRLLLGKLVPIIDGILITHLHDDHVGSLSSFIYYYNIVLGRGRIPIYCPTPQMREALMGFLSYGMSDPSQRAAFLTIDDLPGAGFIDTYGWHSPGMMSYGYYFTDGKQSIVFSGDNGKPDLFFAELDKLNLPSPTVFHEIFFFGRIVPHTFYEDLMPFATRYNIYGYHCDPADNRIDNTIKLVADVPELNY